jgi:Acetyltransferase (GNAT) domain
MQAAFRGMRERNVHLSILYPFAHSYYRRYGWELASETINYDLNPTELLSRGFWGLWLLPYLPWRFAVGSCAERFCLIDGQSFPRLGVVLAETFAG